MFFFHDIRILNHWFRLKDPVVEGLNSLNTRIATPEGRFAWMSRTGSDRINGDRINGLFHLLIHGVFLGVE